MLMCASQLGNLGEVKSIFGSTFVEAAVELQYCSSKGGCIPQVVPGVPTDFFDVISGRNVCNDIARFLKIHNPALDEVLMRIQCKAPNPTSADFFAIPDIVTHQPGRTEFYEIKPLSPTGTSDGRKKLIKFEVQCGDFNITMYDRGTLFSPNEDRQIGTTVWLGLPFKIRFRFSRTEPGLIQWDICLESDLEIVGQALWKGAVTRAIVALLLLAPEFAPIFVLARSDVETGAGNLVGITGSVGQGGNNDPVDSKAVQILLNEWRSHNDRPLIAMDGLVGNQTIASISDFQSAVFGFSDGLVDVGLNTMAALEREFLLSFTSPDPALLVELDVAAILGQARPAMIGSKDDNESDSVDDVAVRLLASMLRVEMAELRVD